MANLFKGKKKSDAIAEPHRMIIDGDMPGQIFLGGASAAWTQSFKLKAAPTSSATSAQPAKVVNINNHVIYISEIFQSVSSSYHHHRSKHVVIYG